ncbi:phage tail length tape measure family protein [Allomesorhizobium alhagi]|uniref:Bacteriophage tail tape measure N-terminal domain-containing protein n=1 Tax=Mesorhizobium alhagi CCNWXJ12-2 TaxID=1107882 RepID=H0HQT3_9HYPH|nr:phage tail length tape measure family protein [Mesorhizobium alhagi]EHK56897.1 hypothetical protein MAXJ12_12567 [Mesorhizobium alhagi CCNWXJ12-2]
MTTELRTLRVSADMDPAKYVAGANQKVAADKAMTSSAQGVGAAIQQTDTKISQAGDVLARLSRQYVDGYASAQRMQSAVNSLSRGIDAGKISMSQAEPILEGIFRKYGQLGDGAQFAAKGQHEFAAAITSTTARLSAQAVAANTAAAATTRLNAAANQNARGAGNALRGGGNFNASNAAFQVQDIAMMAMMGQSPIATALQQGPQLAMVMQMGGGLSALASGLMSLVSPTMLITVGMTAAAAAAIQYFSKSADETKKSSDVLKDHEAAVKRIEEVWGKAATAADTYGKRSSGAAGFGLSTNIAAMEKRLREMTEPTMFGGSAIGSTITGATEEWLDEIGGPKAFRGTELFKMLSTDIDAMIKAAREGSPDIIGFVRRLEEMGAASGNTGIRGLAGEIANALREVEAFARALADANRLKNELFNTVGPNGMLLSQGTANREDMGNLALFQSQERMAAQRRRDAANASFLQMTAKSPAERSAAARAAAAAQYNDSESAAARADRIDLAGKLALAEAEIGLSEARKERARSLDATMAQQQLEISLIGQTAGEVARLRMEYDLTSKLREEAARNGVAADEKELALIKEKAAEYGRYAEQIARANLNRDLAFERDQLGRSSIDQQIASRLRSAGLAVDLNSPEAQQMRAMDEFTQLRDGIKGFFSDFRSQLVQSGGDIGEALGNSLLNALNKQMDKELDRLFEQLASSLSSWLLGGKGGATGGVAAGGGIIGAVLGGAANDNFSAPAGAVSRGAGGAVDLASNLLGLSEKNPGQINSFLKAGGVDLNAAQTAWCAAFVNSSLEQIGVDGTGSLTANSFLNWGTKIDPSQVLKGDVLVKPNGFGIGQTGGHVGFATGATRMGASGLQLEMLSGNTGGPGLGTGGVGLDWIDAAKLDVRRATEGVGKLGGAAAAATQGLGGFAGGLGQLGNALMSIGGGAGGSGWFSGLMGAFGGLGGAVGHMMSISPLATSFIAGGGVGLFHSGGIAGYASSMRYGVDPRVFIGAPRLHNGGIAGDEVPAILRRGEPVFKSMAHAREVVGGGSQHITIGISEKNGNLRPFVESVVQSDAPPIANQASTKAVSNYSYRQRQGGAAADDHRYKRLKRMG